MDETSPPEESPARWRPAAGLAGFVAGVLGSAVALGFGELVEGTSETIPSLVIAVGEVVTDYTPGDVVAFSIANIGASQKTVLTAGIVVLSLAIGGLLGGAAARGRRNVAVGGFAAFGLVGGWAAARNPLSPAAASWIVALAAAVLAAAVTLFLASRATGVRRSAARGTEDARGAESDAPGAGDDAAGAEDGDGARERSGPRRSFLAYAAGAAVTALSLVGLGRRLRGPSAAEKARELYTLPPRDPDPASGATTGGATTDANTAVEVPEGIEIEVPEGIEIEIPEGIEIEGLEEAAIDVPEGIEIKGLDEQAGSAGRGATTPGSEEIAPPTTAEPGIDGTGTEPTPTTAQQPEEPATTTTQSPEEPATTTTRQPEEVATTTTRQPEQPATTTQQPEEVATTATQPPEEVATTTTQPPEEPATTTTQPPEEPATTTTQKPQQSSPHPQVSHLDTLDDEVAGISPYITPISPKNQFYRIDTALTVPQVDPDRWRLRITGLVDNPYELTYQDIRAMRLADYVITLSCVSNVVGGSLVGNAVWTGVPLNVLLQRAGVQRGAQQIVGRSVDDFTAGFPTTAAYDGRNAILAIGMNNEPLPLRHGFPARIVVAGLYGYVSAVKWIEEIHLTTWDGFDGYWVPRGWSKMGPMKTQSRIDVPKGGSTLRVGQATAVAGIAWAPTRGIQRVEVRIGDEDWVPCRLGQALGNESWVQWHREWTPSSPGQQQIQVRATDGSGYTQSGRNVRPRPNGAEGWHTIGVNVR